MKVNLNQPIKNVDGTNMNASKQAFVVNEENKLLLDKDGVNYLEVVLETPEDTLTIKKICKTLLFYAVEGEKKTDDYQVKKFDLGMKIISQPDVVELTANEITILQDLVKLKYNAPVLSIQFCKILDGQEVNFE